MRQGSQSVLCRPALARDTAQALGMVKGIWQGEDYIPQVWNSWLEDERGLLAVAELAGQVVGLGHLADMGLGEGWLEGLRVAPQFQGRHFGSHLHEYFVGRWQSSDLTVVRLATNVSRVEVHRMCERTSFRRVGEVVFHRAPALPGPHELEPFRGDPTEPADTLRQRGTCRLTQGLMDLGWEFVQMTPLRLERGEALRLWRWRGGEGWLVTNSNDPGSDEELTLTAAHAEDLTALFLDVRRLAAAQGATEVHWLAPKDAGILGALGEAGYDSGGDDGGLFIYERWR